MTQDSFMFLKYKSSDNQFYVFADDMSARFISCALSLDYDTMCGADKFGNIFLARLPEDISIQVFILFFNFNLINLKKVEDDPTGGKLAAITSHLHGAPHRLESIIQFHNGDIITSLTLSSMQPGGQDIIFYTTLMGSFGALLPFQSRSDVDFFQHLEMYMRQECPPLCGRDHLMYRSYYFPVKDVIDGDLCEQFAAVSY